MRTATFSSLAFLVSSLLVKDVIAGPLKRRDYVAANVLVTEQVTVTKDGDGSLHTADHGEMIGASTGIGSTVVSSPVTTVPSLNAPESTAIPSSAPSTTAASAASAAPLKVKDAAATPAAVAASSAPATSNSGDKRGLAYNDISLLSQFTTVANTKTSWAYNWGSSPGGTVPAGLTYVPMFWGLKSVGSWKSDADAAIAAGSKALLGMNEPDLPAQSNMSPADAATAWTANMEPYHGKATLVGPAVTNGGGAMGLTWLSSFLTACSACHIDAIAIHWYDSATNFAYFKQHVTDAYAAGGNRPIWITEFAGSGSADEQEAFLAQALPFLDSLDYVQKYAYFMVSDGNLVSGKTISALGEKFASS